jgi:hypothetical protein
LNRFGAGGKVAFGKHWILRSAKWRFERMFEGMFDGMNVSTSGLLVGRLTAREALAQLELVTGVVPGFRALG